MKWQEGMSGRYIAARNAGTAAHLYSKLTVENLKHYKVTGLTMNGMTKVPDTACIRGDVYADA